MSQITWLLKEVVSLQVEYMALCKSIRRFEERFFSKKFESSIAFMLKSCKTVLLEAVASVCSNIALCMSLTIYTSDLIFKCEVEVPISQMRNLRYMGNSNGISLIPPIAEACGYPRHVF